MEAPVEHLLHQDPVERLDVHRYRHGQGHPLQAQAARGSRSCRNVARRSDGRPMRIPVPYMEAR
ncbi:hypothetical protein [Streptomyces rameus]|uniref:hypothetical protein n=1 Tax=Streptomyces rameus TaxID=68261 RepID=UPI0031EC694F